MTGMPSEKKFRFDSPDLRTTIPFEAAKNGVFFQVELNDPRPLWFTLDSGAGTTYVHNEVARRLGLAFQGKKQVRGAGEGTVEVDVVGNVSLNLPGLRTWDHTIHAADLSGLDWERRLDGFFGNDFLERFVTTIDYKTRQLIVQDPATFRYDGKGATFPLEFQGRLPFVRAKITVAGNPPEDSLFLVDSGSQDAVDHPLIAKALGTRGTVTGVGLGRETRGVFGRVEHLQLGPFEIRDTFGVAGTGSGSHLIGGEILSKFRVTFDYSRQRLILVKPA